MNILQVSHSFIPCYDSGGVVRSVYTLSKELAFRGHRVTIYTTDGCPKRLDVRKNSPVDMEGFCVYYFRNLSNTLRMRYKIATPIHLLRVISKTIKNFDVIHIHEPRTTIAWIVSYYARKNKIPYVVHARGSLTLTSGRTRSKKVFDLLFGKKTVTHASKLIALTADESRQYQEMGVSPDKIKIIPNAIDLSLYESIPSKGEFRRKYGISSQEKVILFLGRLNKIKGIDLLLEAFSDINEDLDNARLVIVGPDDGYLPKTNQLISQLKIKDQTIYTGPLYEEDKLAAYVDADVYVLPSRYEIFGNTVLEACACGTPVIVTDRCGVSDFVEEFGYVVPFSKDELKETILKVLKDDSSPENEETEVSAKDEPIELLKGRFSQEVVVDKIENVYKNLLKHKTG